MGRDTITINSIQFSIIEYNQNGKGQYQCLGSTMRENLDFHGTW